MQKLWLENKLLQGNRILITGANGGIGYSIAETLLKNNANLVLCYSSNRQNIDKLIQTYPKYKSNIEIFKINLADFTLTTDIIDKILQKGHIDAFIHSVTNSIKHSSVLNFSWDEYQSNIDIQTRSFFEIIQKIVPLMKIKKKGRIINILTSYVVGTPPKQISPYLVGKYSLLGLSKSLAIELAEFGITVNCISPSMTQTQLIDDLPSKLKEISKIQNPSKRLANPSDIASAVLFYCSDTSDFVTGSNLLVTGGENML